MIQKLIDAYELEREMYRKCIDTDEEIEKGRAKWDSGLWIRYKVFEDTITLAPRVDPVKHGHWIEHDAGLICSECGHYTESMYDEPFNNKFGKGWALKRPYYCGYCGAKMNEVETK